MLAQAKVYYYDVEIYKHGVEKRPTGSFFLSRARNSKVALKQYAKKVLDSEVIKVVVCKQGHGQFYCEAIVGKAGSKALTVTAERHPAHLW